MIDVKRIKMKDFEFVEIKRKSQVKMNQIKQDR